MKHFVIIILWLTFIVQHSFSQNVYPSSGNVGLGTSSPAAQLHVKGDGWIMIEKSGSAFESGIQYRKNGNSLFYMYSDNADNDALKIQSTGIGAGENDSSPRIHIPYENRNLYLALSGGNVGIGTNAPISPLHINVGSADVLRIQNHAGGLGNRAGIDFSTFSGTGKAARIEAIDQGGYNGDLAFSTDGDNLDNANVTEKMRITNSGNVGIGTTSPRGIFDIAPPGDIFLSANPNAGTAQSIFLPGHIFVSPHNGSNVSYIQARRLNNSGNTSLQFRTSNSGNVTDAMFIQSDGNVGIGTLTPDAKLTVKGNIHTQEVKVDLNGAVAPDYVFEKDYKLPSLESVKEYIDTNKHLPEVPSAKEMEEKGINVSEMNMLLLKKVEELTLYMIELKSENQSMKKVIEELKSKID
jgi:Phage T4 tail fibre